MDIAYSASASAANIAGMGTKNSSKCNMCLMLEWADV